MDWLSAILGFGYRTAGGGTPNGFLLFAAVAAIIVGLVSTAISGDRSLRLLDEWAVQHGYRILSRESRWLIRGPFFWSSGKNHDVYRIVAEHRDGYRRDGWARVGRGFLWWPGRVDVRWDPPPPPREEPQGFPVILLDGKPPPDATPADRAGDGR